MKLIVQGGKSLKGDVVIRGAKNSGFKLMIASLMAKAPSVLNNITRAGETKISSSIIKNLGGKIEFKSEHSVKIDPRRLSKAEIPFGVGKESRASSLYIPALLYRFGKARVPWPGGDKIGLRPLDRHLEGMRKMGLVIKADHDWLMVKAPKGVKGATYRFAKNTHSGTDTLVMLSAFAQGETVLENAALEPEIDDLIDFLNKMGAKIKRKKPRTIISQGVKEFGSVDYSVMPDRNEAVTFACAALGTKGAVSIFNVRPGDLDTFINKILEIGGKVELGKNEMRVEYQKELKSVKIETRPHPGFMTDWQSLWFTLMTQARGKSTIIERIYPNRFQTANYLKNMGARIRFFNPVIENPAEYYDFNPDTDQKEYYHGAEILGPTALHGVEACAGDIRTGAALLLAALIAQGKTVICEAEKVFRGYENLDIRLQNLGGNILRVKD
ncbi:MAG: UDP-N-acetylglucosamine 1-carboxyvinyltransferase [Candidatus Shapirobacteria bacterium]